MPLVFPTQAPGSCVWRDVCQLFDPETHPNAHTFNQFEKTLKFKRLPLNPRALEDREIDDCHFRQVFYQFREPLVQPRWNDEKVVQPLIHSALTTAAILAEQKSGRNFSVVSEPSINAFTEDRLADEAVLECVSNEDLMKILVEVKGRATFPLELDAKGLLLFESAFSQLMQQTAMALLSKYWMNEVIVALATSEMWYFFTVVDRTEDTNADIQFSIVESLFHRINAPFKRVDALHDAFDARNEKTIDTLTVLLHFLCNRLLCQ